MIYKKLSSFIRPSFSEVETYGFNDILRQYTGYPQGFPISSNIYHGWYIHPPRQADLEGPWSAVLVFNRRQQKDWSRVSAKPAHVVGAPFVHYRRMMNIQKLKSARGTIVYPGHDATSIDAVFDQLKLCEQLSALEDEFKPITVSCTEMDMKNGRDKLYREYGFEIFQPGERRSISYVKNVYEGLAKHKYSCGNHIGTNILFSVEMGIPFFLIGELVYGINRVSGERVVYERTKEQSDLIEYLIDLFSFPVEEVTEEQNKIILEECGLNDCLSPSQLKRSLYKTLFFHDAPRVFRNKFSSYLK